MGSLYQIWCNGAVWSGLYSLEEAFRRIADLADREVLDRDRVEWTIRIVKV